MQDNSHHRSPLQSLLDIDRELARLLARRARLLNKATGGRKNLKTIYAMCTMAPKQIVP